MDGSSNLIAGVYSRAARFYDVVVTRTLIGIGIPGGRDAIAAWAAQITAEDAPVLDVPTGTGEYLGSLPSPVVGVDLALGMLRLARARHPGAPLLRADVFRLPFPDASIGAVFSALGLHLFPRPRDAIAEMARVLRPGGRLVGAVPVWLLSPQFVGGPAAVRRVLHHPLLRLDRLERRRFVVLFVAVKEGRPSPR